MTRWSPESLLQRSRELQRIWGNRAFGHVLNVLTNADETAAATAKRLWGKPEYGPYLASYNAINPLSWPAGQAIIVPPQVDSHVAWKILREDEACAAELVEAVSGNFRQQRAPGTAWAEDRVKKIIGAKSMLVPSVDLDDYVLSDETAAFLSAFFIEAYGLYFRATPELLKGVRFHFVVDPEDRVAVTRLRMPGDLWRIRIDIRAWSLIDWIERLGVLAHELVHVIQDEALPWYESNAARVSRENSMPEEERYTVPEELAGESFAGQDPNDSRFLQEQIAKFAEQVLAARLMSATADIDGGNAERQQ
jgi:hypothetical protein